MRMGNEWPLSQRHHAIAELPEEASSGVLPPFFSVSHCRSSSSRPFSAQNSTLSHASTSVADGIHIPSAIPALYIASRIVYY